MMPESSAIFNHLTLLIAQENSSTNEVSTCLRTVGELLSVYTASHTRSHCCPYAVSDLVFTGIYSTIVNGIDSLVWRAFLG
jgi:hypothetical protein